MCYNGVSGSRVSFFRLCIMFLFIVIGVLIFLMLLAVNLWNFSNLFPILQTPPLNYISSMKQNLFPFFGFEIILFYTNLVSNPKNIRSYTSSGIAVLTLLYILIYLTCVSVISQPVLKELPYPVIELGKTIGIKGGFFERFDVLFFTVWIMTLFTTVGIYIDVAIFTLKSIYTKRNKHTFIFVIIPIIYFFTLIPKNSTELAEFAIILSYLNIIYITIIPTLLLLISYKKKSNSSKE